MAEQFRAVELKLSIAYSIEAIPGLFIPDSFASPFGERGAVERMLGNRALSERIKARTIQPELAHVDADFQATQREIERREALRARLAAIPDDFDMLPDCDDFERLVERCKSEEGEP